MKHLVELHGGSVQAASAGEGEGATFVIRLPFTGRIESYPNEAPQPPPVPSDETVALDSLRVLLVEDEPDTLEYLQRLLQDHGGIVFTARSGQEALAIVGREHLEMLISDIGLPAMDGYDLMRQIRSQNGQSGYSIPAIALTAYARAEDRVRALEAGFDDHIAKPAEPASLLAIVSSLAQAKSKPRA